MSDWCILRTSGRHTLPLADSLNDGGFECWTPAKHIRKRIRRARVELPAPILPTFVFARCEHLNDLLEISGAPVSEHPSFSVFHYLDRIPLVADMELAWLRAYERKKERGRHMDDAAHSFMRGDQVDIREGAFAGMSGIVQHSNGKYAMVLFAGKAVYVAKFLLHPREMAA